jgi:hypothetical protein
MIFIEIENGNIDPIVTNGILKVKRILILKFIITNKSLPLSPLTLQFPNHEIRYELSF